MSEEITIIGSGPTGLMTGCLLQQKGHSTVIFEKNKRISQKTKGLMVHAKSLELLETIGAAKIVIQQGLVVPNLNFYVDNSLEFSFSFSSLKSNYPYYVIITQPQLEEILSEAYLNSGGKIHHQHDLIKLHQKNNKVVLSIKTPLSLIKHLTSYCIGCDGANSTVRKQLKIPFLGESYSMRYVLAEGCLSRQIPTNEASGYSCSW